MSPGFLCFHKIPLPQTRVVNTRAASNRDVIEAIVNPDVIITGVVIYIKRSSHIVSPQITAASNFPYFSTQQTFRTHSEARGLIAVLIS